jgi:hypothetical protein
MVHAREIRWKASEWLDGLISLAEFHRWFAAETSDIHDAPKDSEARRLAAKIDLSLSEYSGGYLSLEDLRNDFQEFLATHPESRELANAVRPFDVTRAVWLSRGSLSLIPQPPTRSLRPSSRPLWSSLGGQIEEMAFGFGR